MKKLLVEIIYDANFIKDHKLQPGWYKIFKIFLILGMIIGYATLFGIRRTLIFCGIFFLLGLIVHLFYRTKTEKFTKSWLDFEAVTEEEDNTPRRIGPHYYIAVIFNLIISILISQLV